MDITSYNYSYRALYGLASSSKFKFPLNFFAYLAKFDLQLRCYNRVALIMQYVDLFGTSVESQAGIFGGAIFWPFTKATFVERWFCTPVGPGCSDNWPFFWFGCSIVY